MQRINMSAISFSHIFPILCFFILNLVMTLSLSVYDFSISMAYATTQEHDSTAPDERVQRLTAYMTKTSQLMQEIELLTTQPGWTEMVQIINLAFSALDSDERAVTIRHRHEFDLWSRKWQTDGEATYAQYLVLSERSKALEAERMGLLEEWHDIRQGLLRIVMWLVVQGADKGEASIELLKLVLRLDREHRETLGRYALDTIDLCQER